MIYKKQLFFKSLFSEVEELKLLARCIVLVGLHSLLLGTFIFFFKETFYEMFFGVELINPFFVKQSGLFLFCLGLFYLLPISNLRKKHRAVDIIILTKIMAVVFLISNAWLVPRPESILLAATCDALMAAGLTICSMKAGLFFKKTVAYQDNNY